MGERSCYAAGTPCWVDVSTSDMETTKTFYAELFGWEPFTIPDPEAGGYTMFRLRGRDVAAVMHAQEGWGPPAWSTYIASDDADATAAAIQEAGGTVLMDPLDVMGSGRMLFAKDPTGGVFGVWQAGSHNGSAFANEAGSFTWNQLQTKDVEAANDFYARVFGWTAEDIGDDSFTYHVQSLNGSAIGGIVAIDPAWGDVPPHWDAFFAVGDTDAAVSRAQELGGSAQWEAMDTPYGRMAQLVDPVGAAFTVIVPAQPAG